MAISDVQQALLNVGTIASGNFALVTINSGDTVTGQNHWYGPARFGTYDTKVVFTTDSSDTTGTMVMYSLVNNAGVATTPLAATILAYDPNYVLLQDSNGDDLLLANDGQLSASDSGLFPITDLATSGSYTPPPAYPAVCFVAGTRIRTERGEIAVEDLVEGDRVHVQDGNRLTHRPVIWIGYRDVNLTARHDPYEALPVRIRRDAFAKGAPHRDLLVSPPHAVFTDGKLIPAKLLVNGATIVRETRLPKVRYYHVELDQHSVLFSEGLTTESYLDTGNRSFFQNGGNVIDLNAGFARGCPSDAWELLACAPLVHDPAAVQPVWQRLKDRAEQLGYAVPAVETTRDPAPKLIVGDLEVLPIRSVRGLHTFVVASPAREVRLRTRSARLRDTRPWVEDPRLLGVPVSRIRIQAGCHIEDLALDGPAPGAGWWGVEQDGSRMWRWTNGDAVLRLPEARSATRVMEITMGEGMYYPLAAINPDQDTRVLARIA